MDRIQELLAKLADLTAEEITELRSLIDTEVEAVAAEPATAETADLLEALADASESVAGEVDRRDTEQAEITARRDAQLERLRPAAPADPDPDAATAEAAAQAEAEAAAEAAAAAETPQAVAASAQTPAARSARLSELAARRPHRNAPEARPATGVQHTQGAPLYAAPDVPGVGAGTAFTSLSDLAERFNARAGGLGRTNGGGDGEQVVVASARREFPEERQLGNDGRLNSARVDLALAPQALVAAGGLCAPLENIYDVQVIGTTDRPLRSALPGFNATRGGISLRPAQTFQDWNGAVGEWTMAQDVAGTDTKTVLDVICDSFENFTVGAVTLGLRFHNITARTDPEGTAANIAAAEVAFARYAENRLLGKMRAFATNATGGKVLGATRDLLVHYSKIGAYYRSRHRVAEGLQLRATMPTWVRDLMRSDFLMGATGVTLDQLVATDAQINSAFQAIGITPVWHLDGRLTNQAAASPVPAVAAQVYGPLTNGAVIPNYPAQVETLIWVEGDFLYLDSGELDLGIVRDSTLNGKNAYQTFFEEFTGVAFRGIEALNVVSTVTPTGQSAAPVAVS